MTNSQILAKEKIRNAIQLLEQSQRLVNHALIEMSSVTGCLPQYETANGINEALRHLTYDLNEDHDLDLDSLNKKRLGL